MPHQDINRDEIERRRDRLFNRFGEAPIHEQYKSPPQTEFETWVEMSNDGYIGSAYALVRRLPEDLPALSESMAVEGDERERVLLILGRGGSEWGVPGGGQEDAETFEETAHREVLEEEGIDISLTGLNYIRHEIATRDGFDERLHVLRVFFEAQYESGSVAIQSGELNGAAWFANPPVADRLMADTKRLLNRGQPE